MAPRKGETKRARAARQARESNIGLLVSDQTLIGACMADAPSCIPMLKEFLIANGYLNEKSEVIKKEQPLVERKGGKSRKSEIEAQLQDEEDDFDEEQPIPHESPLQSTPEYMVAVLCRMDGQMFHKHSVRQLCKRGQKKPTRSVLLELLEFATGLEPCVAWQSMGCNQNLIQFVKKLAEDMGHRSRNVWFPPVWSDMGCYRLTDHAGILKLEDKYSKGDGERKVVVGDDLLGAPYTGKLDDYELVHNFSLKKCMIHVKGTTRHVRCQDVFHQGAGKVVLGEMAALEDAPSEHEGEDFVTPAKRPRLARSSPGSSAPPLTITPVPSTPTSKRTGSVPLRPSLTRDLAEVLESMEEADRVAAGEASTSEAQAELAFDARGLIEL